MIFRSRKRYSSMPPRNITGTQSTSETKGSSFQSAWPQKAPNIPSITISPWARLMMRITPKTTVSPMPIMA